MNYLIKYFLLAVLLIANNLFAQSINLDKPIKAGDLICFPDINKENEYYYISDKPKLSMGENNKPKFSFLRYVKNSKSTTDQGRAEGDAGGIVHAVVSLAVTKEQLDDAKQAIQQVKPGAKIVGPVVYRSGTFGIVSSFKDPEGGLSQQVLGLGKAPILDGQQAAISIQLTHKGTEILWESFKTAAPDISFTFEMEIGGYRSPKNAVIEANFDQVYEHKSFQAGVAMSFIAAEIKLAFDDLVRSGAIKVTQVGEDEKMEAMIATAYNKIAEMMFSPMNGTGNLGLEQLGSITGGNSPSVLDRATNLLKSAREEANATNAANERRRASTESSSSTSTTTSTSTTRTTSRDSTGRDSANRGATRPAPYSGSEPGRVDSNSHVASVTPADRPTNNTANSPQDVAVPSFAVVATFQMKKVRQQGIFRIDLNKSTVDNITMRFDENIGNLTRYSSDSSIFRSVNLDDPFYKQREIAVKIDGANASDFGQYINHVNLRLKKTHENSEITMDEVRIDKDNFNKEGNLFRLLYGYKGDNNRENWFNYEYETEWSFFGGHKINQPLSPSAANIITVAPPLQRKTIEFQAAANELTNAGIRLVTVTVFYHLGTTEQKKQVTLNPANNELSKTIDIILPNNSDAFDYEITWRLANNTTRTSGRQTSNEPIVFVDQLPN